MVEAVRTAGNVENDLSLRLISVASASAAAQRMIHELLAAVRIQREKFQWIDLCFPWAVAGFTLRLVPLGLAILS
jgi:hypothetical protein